MSKVIDEKVVSMKFDNAQFEKNVSASMSTLDKLKKSLNLEGASKGLDSVNEAAKRCDFSSIGNGIETVKAKFSALQVIAATALGNITNQIVNTGKRLVSEFTIEPVKAGFQEYETQMNSVQTILANTQKEGTNVKVVNKALDELNTYADKTIYNFTEMTRNIGTFTAAGVKLDTSVSSIKGIANLAAVSGSTSQQASTAMYQLSQAIASGTVKLMDWNSVVNAGMGGQVFQDALIRTSEHLKTGAKSAIKAKGSFRESLTTGWLTTEVLTQTLDQFATAADTQEEYEAAVKKFIDQGYSKEQAKQMADMAKTAGEAATKVKTFTQLMDTLKEAAGSGWTTTWRLIIGDFEEAKGLWTKISDRLSDMINKSSDARNKLVEGWAKGGGRDMLIESLENSFEGLLSMIKPIKEAFREIFPASTSKQLITITERLRDFTKKLKMSSETADKVKRTFKGIFAIFDLVKKAVIALIKPLYDLSQSKGINSLADLFLYITAAIGDFFTSLNEGAKTGKFFSTISEAVSKAFGGISKVFENATNGLRGFCNIFSKVRSLISKVAGKIKDAFIDAFSFISKVAGKIKDAFVDAFNWITDNISIGNIFAGLAAGSIFKAMKKFSGLIDKIKDVFSKTDEKKTSGIGEQFKSILDQVHGALESFTTGIKISSLVSIAIAIGILTASLKTISQLKAGDIAKSVAAIGAMMKELSSTFKSLTETLKTNGAKDIVKSAFSLILMAKAIKILADAVEKISQLSLFELGKGLAGVGVGLVELCAGIKFIGKLENKISLKTSIAMIALAYSCKLLADALQKFSTLSWDEIGRGLTSMGGALTEFVVAISVLNKFGGGKSIFGAVAILIAVQSLEKMSDGLKNFADMSWDEIGRGLTSMGGALGELGIVLGALGKIAGFSSIIASASILITAKSLDDLANALKKFAEMSWDEIGRGLSAMGGALLEVSGLTGALGKIAGLSALLGAGAIWITIQGLNDLANAFKKFGDMSWDEIGRGLSAMGGALLEVGVISGALGYITGIAGILGAATIWTTIQGLDDLANVLNKFGEMSWDEIGRGLVAMGGALLEVGGISGALGYLTGIAGILGSGALLITIQGLDDLANALKKFGDMSWDEIGRGLVAMGGVLYELAIGGLLNTLSVLGSISIAKVAEPLGVLADSIRKWSGVTVPETLGAQLGSLAWGVMKFTLGGSGASAIAEVAGPLGVMADSVKKWSDVVVPENLGKQCGQLAKGVRKFIFTGLGAGGLEEAAEPLGTLADSVKKWEGVTVPEGLRGQLNDLANGIESFSFAFMGGWSISAVIDPLSNLVDAVNKWKDVTIPSTLCTDLTSLATGIESFSFAFMGGWSLDDIVGPLGDLAGSIKKWTDVTIPVGFKDNLKNIANGIKEFGLFDAAKISMIAEPLSTLGKALRNIGSISGTGENLIAFTSNIKYCISNLTGIDASAADIAVSTINKLVETIKKVNSTSVSNVAAFVTAANSLNNIKINEINADTKGLSSAVDAIKNAISSMCDEIISKKSSLESAMKTSVSGLGKAASSKKNDVKSAGESLGKAAAKGIKDKKSSFKSAGKWLGDGLIEGINSKQQAVYDAGYDLGKKAAEGEKDGQKSNSPSKLTVQAGKWLGEGLIIGMRNISNRVYDSGYDLGKTAVDSMSSTISRIADIVNSDIDAQPTIRPVVDLSNVADSANSISGMLNITPSIGVLSNVRSINSMMNRRQNGVNSEVVSAIKDLKDTMNQSSGDTYQINGITYDDGSNISDAVRTLVRAAKVERRS